VGSGLAVPYLGAMSTSPVIIVGAGAAGLMAGIFAARAGIPTHLVEGTADGGRKILISGGGRCNVLPGTFRPERFVTDSSPNTLKKILRSWPLAQQRTFFEDDLGIPLKREEEFDKLFPVSDRAQEVRDALVEAYTAAGGTLWTDTRVVGLAATDEADSPWRVELDSGRVMSAAAVVLATGGLSVPKTGSDGWGLGTARRLGHTIHATYPALTPLLADPPVHAGLAGLTVTVRIVAPGARPGFDIVGSFLFTHRGYSGPAALDASHFISRPPVEGSGQSLGSGPTLLIQWAPKLDADAWEGLLGQGGSGAVAPLVRRNLPRRLADHLVREADVDPERPLATLPRAERKRLVTLLARYPLPVTGEEGYRKAEVTGGGVALDQIDPRTMQSRTRPGLFLCGELLDAFGPIGGHNFMWAWATGRAAGLGAAGRANGAGSQP